MARTWTRVTPELVREVHDLTRRFPAMTNDDLRKMAGSCSTATISKIRKGEYDHLIGAAPKPKGSKVGNEELYEAMCKNNALLADIATMLVNFMECANGHTPSKGSEAHFRANIKKNRIERTED